MNVVWHRIRVLFSIADINNAAPDDFLVENEEGEEAMAPSFPVRASVTIEKVKMAMDMCSWAQVKDAEWIWELYRRVRASLLSILLLRMVKWLSRASCFTVIPSSLVNNPLKQTGNVVVCTLVPSSLSWMRYVMGMVWLLAQQLTCYASTY